MKRISFIAALLTLFATADWQFVPRSDIAPPRLHITILASKNVESGYLFMAPFAGYPDTAFEQHGPRQAGPYIFRDDRELIWLDYSYYSICATNFQAARWKGRDVLFSFEGDHKPNYGYGHGHTTICDEDQQWIVNAIFQELDIETGKLLFEWESLGWVWPDEAVTPLNPGQAGSGHNSSDAWDYFHINSVDKNVEGDYLISARDACSVHKISGTDGSIIWRLDGMQKLLLHTPPPPNASFCFQHHARFQPHLSPSSDVEVVSLYDNAAHGTENGRGSEIHTAPTSSGKILALNTTSWTASFIQGFNPRLAQTYGPLTEYDSLGNVLFHTYFDSGFLGLGVQNYPGFRREGETMVYVSCNGDTETRVWRFYAVTGWVGARRFLGEVERKGFEMRLEVTGKGVRNVVAEAVLPGKSGKKDDRLVVQNDGQKQLIEL
ncbi:ASST-domain-containing protein [Clohesyomyces aquaticus]|uniref:ASST-domain-containing protein n=1 Tax=Clohesyomyces aquaticus TaxID=1231657 RepID=A0A1Y1ZTR1_9PLEO|nr:ASST-domain-containing protein [Clohesyomyces aquaticus]